MVLKLDQEKIARALTDVRAGSSDFDLNPTLKFRATSPPKPAGVLLPLIEREAGPSLILTKRSTYMTHHPGQIALPGGRVEPDDRDHIAAALREADEEIGLPADSVKVLGELPTHGTVSNYTMYPVVGLVERSFPIVMDQGEVAEVFEVPLSHVLDLTKYALQSRVWSGQKRSFLTVAYGPYYIWGATAHILRSFADRMA
jgi:8-oxo-dGTP pyrophosphatase MutT (NUDIX family)